MISFLEKEELICLILKIACTLALLDFILTRDIAVSASQKTSLPLICYKKVKA